MCIAVFSVSIRRRCECECACQCNIIHTHIYDVLCNTYLCDVVYSISSILYNIPIYIHYIIGVPYSVDIPTHFHGLSCYECAALPLRKNAPWESTVVPIAIWHITVSIHMLARLSFILSQSACPALHHVRDHIHKYAHIFTHLHTYPYVEISPYISIPFMHLQTSSYEFMHMHTYSSILIHMHVYACAFIPIHRCGLWCDAGTVVSTHVVFYDMSWFLVACKCRIWCYIGTCLIKHLQVFYAIPAQFRSAICMN